MNTDETAFLHALKENPTDRTTLLAYADWLEEHDQPYRALMQRVQAGVSRAFFKLRRKSDGLFSEGVFRLAAHTSPMRYAISWSTQGKEWSRLSILRAHLTGNSRMELYGNNTPWEVLEVVVVEVRVQVVTTLPMSFGAPGPRGRKKAIITEPT